MNILVVDDDIDMRNMLYLYLSKRDHSIVLAENGLEAIQQVEKKVPDLILMDLKMPVLDGISAIKKIRKRYLPAMLPIILLSAETDKTEWIKALNVGANDFVSKPFNQGELFARINAHFAVSDLTNKLDWTSRDLSKKNRLLEKEKSLAAKIQSSILPDSIKFEALDVESFYRPSNKIGGDFFDFFQKSDSSQVFIIGDVSGHGTASALIMAAAKGMINSLGHTLHTSLEVITVVNNTLCEMLDDSGHFITLVYVVYKKKRDELQIISAGHNPIFLSTGGDIQAIESTGPPLGIDPDDSWEITHMNFSSNDTLFLYTDGVVEARNKSGDFYGEERLIEQLRISAEPNRLIQSVSRSVTDFCLGNMDDDITMLAIRVQ